MNRVRAGFDYVNEGGRRSPRLTLQLALAVIAMSAFGSAWLLRDGASAASDLEHDATEAIVDAAGARLAAPSAPAVPAQTATTMAGNTLALQVSTAIDPRHSQLPPEATIALRDGPVASAISRPMLDSPQQVHAAREAAIAQAPAEAETPDEDVVDALARQIEDKPPQEKLKLPSGLKLKSSVVLVVDQNSGEVLAAQNPEEVQPIASLTKLMTALIVTEAKQPLDETLEITDADIDLVKHTYSRLTPGLKFTRRELLLLALMSSENRAASALGRNYPGGLPGFVRAMNARARSLGMTHTHYHDSSGLSSENVSTAGDLVKLVNAAYQVPLIREFSTNVEHTVRPGRRTMHFVSSNRLVRAKNDWHIGLQKTGFTNEAGRCLVMQATVKGRSLVMVLLDSDGKFTRFADAQRVRNWLESGKNHTLASGKTATRSGRSRASSS